MIKFIKYFLYFIPFFLLAYVLLVRYSVFDKYKFLNFLSSKKNQPFQIIADMDSQVKPKPQKDSRLLSRSDFRTLTPDSTYPSFGSKYPFEQIDFAIAESTFKNPLPASEFIINRGKQRFETHCVPCHNFDGLGRGKIITDVKLKEDEEGFPEPANLTRPETQKLSDARIFHILSSGQNLMFPVNDKLSENERWALVHYIRYLQKKENTSRE